MTNPVLDLKAVEAEQAALQEEMRRPPGVATLRQEWEAHHVGPMLGLLDRAEAAERNVTALLTLLRETRGTLDWLVHLNHGGSKGGGEVMHSEWNNAWEDAVVVLAKASEGQP